MKDIENKKSNPAPYKGAWLAANSWGSNTTYFYVSYFDASIADIKPAGPPPITTTFIMCSPILLGVNRTPILTIFSCLF